MTKKASKQPKYDFFKRLYFAIYNHFVNSNPDKEGFGINMLKYTLAIPFCIPTCFRPAAYNKAPSREELDYAFIFFNPFKESNYYVFIIDIGMVVEFIDGRINVLFYEKIDPQQYTHNELIDATIELAKEWLLSIESSGAEYSVNIKKFNSLQAQANAKAKEQNESFDRDQYFNELALENLRQVYKYHHFLDGFNNIKSVYSNCLKERIKSLLKNKVVKNSREVLKEMLDIENCDPYLTSSLSVKNLIKYGILEQFFYNDKMVINSLQLELEIPNFVDDIYLVEISENGFDENRLGELNNEYLALNSQIKSKALEQDLTLQSTNKLGNSYIFKKTDIIPANTFFIPFSNPSTDRVILGYSLDEDFVKEIFPSQDCSAGAATLALHWRKPEVRFESFKTTATALFCSAQPEHFNTDVGLYPVIGLQFAKKYQKMLQDRFDDSLRRFVERVDTKDFISEQEFLDKMRDIYQLLQSRNELEKQFRKEQAEYFCELADLIFTNDEVI